MVRDSILGTQHPTNNDLSFLQRFQAKGSLILHLFFIPLFYLAYHFYQERLCGDAGSDLYHMILHGNSLLDYHPRIILYFVWLLPSAIASMDLQLETILIATSLGYVLFNYLIFVLLVHVLKDNVSALFLIVIQVFGILYNYYAYPMSEVLYGSGLLILYYSIHRHNTIAVFFKKPAQYLLLILIISSHPMMIILMVYLILFDLLQSRKPHYDLYFFMLIVGIFIFYFRSDHDVSMIQLVGDNLRQTGKFGGILSVIAGAIPNIIRYLLINWEVGIIFLMIVIYYLRNKSYKILGFSLLFLVGFHAITYISLVEFKNNSMLSSYYFPIVIIVGIPFFYDLVQEVDKYKKMTLFVICGIMVLMKMNVIYQIGCQYSYMTDQVQRITSHARQLDGDRYVINSYNIIKHYCDNMWYDYLPFESVLLSSQNGRQSISLIPNCSQPQFGPGQFYSGTTELDSLPLVNCNPDRWYDSLSVNYFDLSMQDYEELNAMIPNDLGILKDSVALELISAAPMKLRRNKSNQMVVKIVNKASQPIYSNFINNIYLRYVWLDEKGDAVNTAPDITPIEVDVVNEYSQPISILSPKSKGRYTLVLGIEEFNQGFIGKTCQVEVVVK